MGVLQLLLVAGVAVASPNYVAHFRRDLPPNVTPPSSAGFQNATFHPSRGGGAVCVSGFVPVTASARNLRFKNFRIPQNQTDATDTFLKYFSAGSTYPQDIMAGMQTASGTYSIGATFCSPGTSNSTNSSSTVELLTHGIGFDRHYWDFAPDYSYVDVAAKNGHSTFFYDRLSVGLSSKEDPLNTVQAAIQVEIANVLATSLRNGTYSNTKFSNVIGVGHSFGSIITEAVTSKYPTSLSAAILTGFSVNSTGTPPFLLALNLAIAAINQPIRFANFNPGYLVDDTVISAQTGFFRAPNFDPQILAAAENTKGTTTYGELFSITAVLAPANNFTGPVAVINGANDLPFCFGNCSYPTDLAAAVKPALYSNLPASKFTSYLAPLTGHGVNFHYTATAAFNFIESFLKQQGL